MKLIDKFVKYVKETFFEKVPSVKTVMGNRTSAAEYAKLCEEREQNLNNIKAAMERERAEIYDFLKKK